MATTSQAPLLLHFLPSRTVVPSTSQDEILARSQIREHACRYRVQTYGKKKKSTPHPEAPPGSYGVIYLHKQRYDRLSRTRKARPPPPQAVVPVPATVEDPTGCPPFLSFPYSIQKLDRSLFHFFMSYVAIEFYGENPNSTRSVVRNCTLPNILTGETFLSIIVGVVGSVLNSLTVQPRVPQQWLVAREAVNYRLLRRTLQHSHMHPRDWIIVCILGMGYADQVSCHIERSRQHTKAALSMIGDLRNIQQMEVQHASSVFKLLLLQGCPEILGTTYHAPLQRATKALATLIASDVGENGAAPHTDAPRCEACPVALHPDSKLLRLLSLEVHVPTPDNQRLLLACLFMLNDLLNNLQREVDVLNAFLTDLDTWFKQAIVDYGTKIPRRPRFVLQNVMYMIIASADKHELWRWDGDENFKPAVRAKETLEFVEATMLLPPGRRRLTIELMRGLLYADRSCNHSVNAAE